MKKFKLIKCIYEKEKQTRIIRSIFEDSFNILKSEFDKKGNHTDIETDLLIETVSKLYKTAPSFKDISFQDEKEWRFIAKTKPISTKIKYREGKSMIIPYITVPLLDKDILNIPIARLIVGPTPHKELAFSSVKTMLLNKGLKDCKFTSSKIPYRAW